MNKVKVGVVGVGSLGQHHARIYSDLKQADFVGLYDEDSARAEEIAALYKTRVFSSLEDLAREVQAASVVVPTNLHRDVALTLMEQGVHLLVEKPIATTTAEAAEMVHVAREKNLLLQVGHIERFNPVLRHLEDARYRPRFIEAHRLAPYPPKRDGGRPRGTEVSVVLDLMIHDLEIILHLVQSPVKEIRAVGVPVLSPTEDIANARIAFENGAVANITASRISPEKMRKIRVFREDAYISLDYMKQEGELYRKGVMGITKKEIPVIKGEPLFHELENFVACVSGHGTPRVTGEQAAEALKLAVDLIHTMQTSAS